MEIIEAFSTPDSCGIPFLYFLFGDVPTNMLDDTCKVLVFLLMLIGIDIATGFFRESGHYLAANHIQQTPFNLIKGLWCALWPSKDKYGNDIRYIFSRRLRQGLSAKLEIYPIFLAISIWSFHLPDHWGIFGLELDDLMYYGFSALPILMEIYSIMENLAEIEPVIFGELYTFMSKVRNFMKGE